MQSYRRRMGCFAYPARSQLPRAAVCDALISHLDVFPTICDYLAISHPSWLQGKSFLPLLAGQVSEINEEIFAEVNYHASYEPKRAVRTSRWKYIRRFGERRRRSYRTAMIARVRSYGCRPDGVGRSWIRRVSTICYSTLTEHANFVDDPAHKVIAQDMRDRLHPGWLRPTTPYSMGW